MRHMRQTTAIAVVLGAFAFGAHAQQHAPDQEDNYAAATQSVCDTPWLQVDSDENGFVSPAEASGAIDQYFAQIDGDGDGNITEIEYTDCLAEPANVLAVEADRNEEAFEQADADASGMIDKREFATAAEDAFTESRSASADDPEAYVVLRRYVWLTPEEGADGSVVQNMTADEAASRSAMTFAALDSDDDGMLGTEEWMERSPASARDEEWANARFDELDGDGNDSVSKEEYTQARSRMLDDMTTSSTTNETAAGSDGQSADASASSSDERGIPVYLYRFWTM